MIPESSEIQYRVDIYTCDRWRGGTDANIYFQLTGERGNTGLLRKNSITYRGTTDTEYFTHKDLGKIYKVTLITAGTDQWCVGNVKIYHDVRGDDGLYRQCCKTAYEN